MRLQVTPDIVLVRCFSGLPHVPLPSPLWSGGRACYGWGTERKLKGWSALAPKEDVTSRQSDTRKGS